MNNRSVLDIICKATEENRECNLQIWVGPDGVFHQDEDCSDGEEISVCSLSYYTCDDHWIVTPWLYNSDCPIVLKKAENARQMAYFWLNWMEYLYGDEDGYGRRFETDWLKVKSNRSLLMMLFSQEGEQLKREIWKDETGEDVPATHGGSITLKP